MKRRIIPYDPKLKERARRLRKEATMAEVLLWRHLKGKQMCGYDFHRQKPLNKYIVDFFCSELMLAIEIDGASHSEKQDADKSRQSHLESLGIRFLRFYDAEVKQNIDGVLREIEAWIDQHTPPFGHPSQEGNQD